MAQDSPHDDDQQDADLFKTLQASVESGFHLTHLYNVERGTALDIVTGLDRELEVCLKRHFTNDGNALGKIFGRFGALGNTAAKVQLGYLLGIYGATAYGEMEAVCEIRNKFAHYGQVNSFDHPEVSAKVDRLKIHELITAVMKQLDPVASSRIERISSLLGSAGRAFKFVLVVQLLTSMTKVNMSMRSAVAEGKIQNWQPPL